MTVRITLTKDSSDRVAHLIKSLLHLAALAAIIIRVDAGFLHSRSSQAPSWQQPQPQQQPQYQTPRQQYGPPAAYYQQQPQPQPMSQYQPMMQQAPNGYSQMQPNGGQYPPQPSQNYPSQDYPMQATRNYPVQQYQPPVQAQQQPPMSQPPPQLVPINQPQQPPQPPRQKFKASGKSDPCGAISISEQHGYMVREYKVITKDQYELIVHRLIHPADVKRMISENLDSDGRAPSEEQLRRLEPKLGDKKPYLLLHGLVGSSASFVRNVDKAYRAPQDTYDVTAELDAILRKRANENELHWRSTADNLNAAFAGDISNTVESLNFAQKLTGSYTRRTFASTKLLDFYGDKSSFAYEFTQAFRKFDMPRKTLDEGKFVPNSLAFTMSNFGYDVWMVNLRGNEYSRGFNGPLSAEKAEYWDFDLDQLVKEDLLATVNHLKKTLGWKDDKRSIGIVTYSYGSLHILGLLTKFPQYQRLLQPVIMMAPTLLSSSDKSSKLKFIIKKASQFLISHTGPFPNRAESIRKKLSIEGVVCKLPVASKLCNLMTMILHGEAPSSVKDIILDDRQQSLMLRDSQCGQTSTGVLHQIVENISSHAILPKYTPYVGAREKLARGDLRRSIMIIRSQADEIANEAEVERIKEAAIKGMALNEVVIEEPKFGHSDFLFSKKNQYLVNAEVARMALVFDFLDKRLASPLGK